MKLTVLVSVLTIASTVVGSNIALRDARTILNDIAQIKSQTQNLKAKVDAFQGGPISAPQALAIQSAANDLDKTIQSATNDAKASNTLSSSDSATVANSVTTLQPLIFATLTSLVNKKAGFQNAALGFSATGLVKNSLVALRQDTAYFGGNVTNKLIPILQISAPLVTADIDFRFERAIEAFS